MKLVSSSALLASLVAFPAMGLAATSDQAWVGALGSSPMIGAYVTGVLVALMVSDYTRRSRTLGLRVGTSSRRTSLLPAEEAFASASPRAATRAVTSSHRR